MQKSKELMQKSKEFYNNFHTKLINDYLSSDPRIIAAIEFALKNIPKNAQNILDIGCGIGWSSYEIKKHYPKANVVALDLSDFNIKTAKKLFNQDGLNYGVLDFTNPLNDNYNLIKDKKFDAIVMLDVYEHISASERSTVHNALNNLLSEEGVLLLACPSKYHQDYLRKEKPEGLQPVDEDITFNELGKLANDVGGDIISFTHANIWRYCYYSYTVIKKNHKFIRRKKFQKNNIKIKISNTAQRVAKIRKNKALLLEFISKEQYNDIQKKMKFLTIKKFIPDLIRQIKYLVK